MIRKLKYHFLNKCRDKNTITTKREQHAVKKFKEQNQFLTSNKKNYSRNKKP